MLSSLIDNARKDFDLTDPSHQESVTALAEALLKTDAPLSEVLTTAGAAESPLEARMAALLADSRNWLTANSDRTAKVAVVFAMWGEQNRLKPKSAENPTGEDSLSTKLIQLDWAARDTAINWTLYAVMRIRGRCQSAAMTRWMPYAISPCRL